MKLFFITLVIFILSVLGLAMGAIFSKKYLKGSCGGLGKIMGKKCEHCGNEGKCKNS